MGKHTVVRRESITHEEKLQYQREYYWQHKPQLAARKAWQQKHDLDYRLRAVLCTIAQRCQDPRHASYRWYGGKGIKNFLTLEDLKVLWIRDGASEMKRPSVDREDASDDYTFDNCCFRELYDNQKRGWENKPARSAAIRIGMTMKQPESI